MRILIGVKSCQRDKMNGSHQAIRDTWARFLPPGVDIRFFIGGNPVSTESDETHIYGGDGYWDLPHKTRAIATYAVREDYDFVYLCDTDTYLWPTKLLKSGFEFYDYSGGRQHPDMTRLFGVAYPSFMDDRGKIVDPSYVWMSGGVGYFLSQKAAEVVAISPFTHWAEDMWVGLTLGPLIKSGEMKAKLLPNFEGVAAQHLGCGQYISWTRNSGNLIAGDETRKMHLLLGQFQR